MKKVLFLLLSSIFSFLVFAQKNDPKIVFPYMQLVYVGFDNLVELTFNEKQLKKLSLECDGCDKIQKVENNFNQWLISVKDQRPIILLVRNRKGKILMEEKITPKLMPSPIVFINNLTSQDILNENPELISLKLEKSVPLLVTFLIKRWKVTINQMEFSGDGNKMTDELRTYMKKIGSGLIILEIDYFDPFGSKKIKEIFEYKL